MYYYNLLSDGVLATSIIACLLSLWIWYKHKVDANFKLLVFILIITVLIEALTTLMYHIQDYTGIGNVLGLYNVYYIIAYLSWFLLFYKLAGSNYKRSSLGVIFLFFTSIIVEAIFFVDYTTKNLTLPHVIGSLCLTVLIVIYFVQILKDGSIDYLKNNLYFWIGCGLLINYLGSLPFNVVTNFFTFAWSEVSESVNYLFYNIEFSLAIVMNLLFCIGLYRYSNHTV